ncbi:hypothetical protein H310_11874 [Aphanomyces invadans]|uniref:ISXO2-like transposase domain-containing protein n=1 Tax=Aphanomyces invadans TaxID=157072 RepID=A0A024TKP3_9STRA|nr:hypothetical protein H310_11874 [Aphanomyces invadans]ETV94613.1 hypothetical protein H310_11874 [Aphanomyces invadans]|eukprot:XP_008876928.1 hypothetical protein H310_11874 [Aphanomyces invadans]
MRHWALGRLVSDVIEDFDVSSRTASDWYSFCRDVCSSEILTVSCEMKIGGVGSFVEIDETSLKKSKYNCRKRHLECWRFGGVDRTTKKWFAVRTYEDRTKRTLSALIRKHVRPGTLIMSDKFGSYVSSIEEYTLANNPTLARMGYSHQWVNHSENFVNPINGAHTQSVEGVWEVRVNQYN